MAVGDPRVYAPDLMAHLTPRERKYVGRAYKGYLAYHKGMYQSASSLHETPRGMARQVVRTGVWRAGWTVAAPIVVLLVYVDVLFFLSGSTVGVAMGALVVLFQIVLLSRVSIRLRRALTRFDELHPE